MGILTNPQQVGLFHQAKQVLESFKQQRDHDRLAQYKPYPVQKKFHDAGATHTERLLISGNQTGKSYAVCAELAMHLTGAYPEWWAGKRFTYPVRVWASSVTNVLLRDSVQKKLIGPPTDYGSGFIPKRCLPTDTIRSARSIADLVDTFYVHGANGASSCALKSYETGRLKWQAESVDIILFDEEPPPDIYIEALARISATKGIIIMGLTPLLGKSDVVKRYMEERPPGSTFIQMSIHDAEHFSPEEREATIRRYPKYQRAARVSGIPYIGSGQVYPVAEEAITVEPFELPKHWARICGLDFGWDHPTAACWLAHDRDNDIVYIYDEYAEREEVPAIHASSIRRRGEWIPIAWPKDGLNAEKSTGQNLKMLYEDEGLNMLASHAAFEEGGVSLETGVMEVLERMKTQRLKVFSTCYRWFNEFRAYHRKKGIIVALDEDILSAMRYGVMMLRYAEMKPDNRPRERGRFNRAPSSLVY